jgi:PhnB protein
MIKFIPDDYHAITPMFVYKDALKAIEFYKKAFDAVERFVMPGTNGQGVAHAELMIGDSIVMMGEENPHHPCKSAETLGSSPISMYLYVKDVDAAFQKALDAGAVSQMEVQDMFWGDRMGTLTDPFGYSWSLSTHTKDMTPEEIKHEAEAAFAQKPVK